VLKLYKIYPLKCSYKVTKYPSRYSPGSGNNAVVGQGQEYGLVFMFLLLLINVVFTVKTTLVNSRKHGHVKN